MTAACAQRVSSLVIFSRGGRVGTIDGAILSACWAGGLFLADAELWRSSASTCPLAE